MNEIYLEMNVKFLKLVCDFVCVFLFQAGNYDVCLQHLTCLQDINKDDYKIILNTAVAEFFKSNQTTTDSLRQTLNQLKNQVIPYMNFIIRYCGALYEIKLVK